jgi:hypothetical protein
MFGTQHSYGMEAITDIYLGLPTQIGVDRSDCFIHLIERVVERLKRFIEKPIKPVGPLSHELSRFVIWSFRATHARHKTGHRAN